jgi:hypothetical protein
MKVTREERAQLEAALRKIGAGAPEATVLDSPLGGRIFLRGRTLWLDYSVRGERRKESAKTQDLGAAKAKLKERMAAAAARNFVGPSEDRLRWSDIQRMLETDYKVKAGVPPAGSPRRCGISRPTSVWCLSWPSPRTGSASTS